jgi:hypothetical protein
MKKAKIRKTGEVVDIVCFNSSTIRCEYDSVSYIDSEGAEHVKEPLNYYWDFEDISNIDNTIDWEQRRYEIAKEILPSALEVSFGARTEVEDKDLVISYAIELADAFIQRLKEK